jgi:hypothetical protein
MHNTTTAAIELGITPGRVRQICRGYDQKGRQKPTYGQKLGRDFIISESDLKKIRKSLRKHADSA